MLSVCCWKRRNNHSECPECNYQVQVHHSAQQMHFEVIPVNRRSKWLLDPFDFEPLKFNLTKPATALALEKLHQQPLSCNSPGNPASPEGHSGDRLTNDYCTY